VARADDRTACRVAVVTPDPDTRSALSEALEAAGFPVAAWAEQADLLVVLGTRVDICLCLQPPPPSAATELRQRGASVIVPGPGADPVEAVRRAAAGRPEPVPGSAAPRLARRQREVLLAYVTGNDVLPTIARRLGMERETFKTHLRRIRDKYDAVGRPAPTRRDLYVRALEDGLIAPPADRRPER
jgi:DNA-binding CsgD family transcriptional regulator